MWIICEAGAKVQRWCKAAGSREVVVKVLQRCRGAELHVKR